MGPSSFVSGIIPGIHESPKAQSSAMLRLITKICVELEWLGRKIKLIWKSGRKLENFFFSKFCFHNARAIQGEVRGQANDQSQIEGVR